MRDMPQGGFIFFIFVLVRLFTGGGYGHPPRGALAREADTHQV